ncbi:cornifelin-like [Dreissena polymorpha]|uniref:Cornifelin n=1 Tax=Dreissena polymorpha TaxID=45954 RepID=A0A9D4DB11_DREPO|nr:cornifelin-like [Dreissena polymorpha]KAH3746342.1 hypothetical protein DPMN_180749 [Dreissena polymorpha]
MLNNCDETEMDRLELPPVDVSPRGVVTRQPSSARGSRSSVGPFTPRERSRLTLKTAARGHRDWTTGLSDCNREHAFTKLYTCLCPCLRLWDLLERLGESGAAALIPCAWPLIRVKVRGLGGIQGTMLGDCCACVFCTGCSICQTSREIDQMIVQPEQYIRPLQ